MQAGVLNMVWSHRLLSFDFHTYVHPNGSRHCRFICSLVCQMKGRYTWLLSLLESVLSTGNKDFNYQSLVLLSLNDLLHPFSVSNPFPIIEDSPRLYQTSMSPLRVRTSMMVWPRKSSLSRLNLCFTRDLMSSSSSHTRTLIRSDELWHSLDEAETEHIEAWQQKSTIVRQ